MYHAPRGTAFAPHGAIALAFAGVATMLVVGIAMATLGAPLYLAVAAGQIAMAALVVLLTRHARGGAVTMGLLAPPLRAIVGCVLLGSSFWYVNMTIVGLLPLPPQGESPLEQLVVAPPWWAGILTIAVVPAVCEELLFRGVLVRSLVPRWSSGFAVFLSAALFAAYHLSIPQLVPTFLLGLVFGHIALCSDSAIPTMVGHFLNNAIALTLARGELPAVATALKNHPRAALGGAIAIATIGYALATVRPRRPGRSPTELS